MSEPPAVAGGPVDCGFPNAECGNIAGLLLKSAIRNLHSAIAKAGPLPQAALTTNNGMDHRR
jgi:hypothetical protein